MTTSSPTGEPVLPAKPPLAGMVNLARFWSVAVPDEWRHALTAKEWADPIPNGPAEQQARAWLLAWGDRYLPEAGVAGEPASRRLGTYVRGFDTELLLAAVDEGWTDSWLALAWRAGLSLDEARAFQHHPDSDQAVNVLAGLRGLSSGDRVSL